MADIRKQLELSETRLPSPGDKNMNTMKSNEPGLENWADFKSILWPESAFPDETCDSQQPTGASPDGSLRHTFQVCLDALALADQAYSGSFVSNPDKNVGRYNSDTLSVDETSNSSPEVKNSNQINYCRCRAFNQSSSPH
ncbi:uncharacterized protein [Procambarus clarkii]|uniref:uncharacterized protein n=1 Tax=Procambarus clarkii TaxID=6728 RepID=UPI0037441046